MGWSLPQFPGKCPGASKNGTLKVVSDKTPPGLNPVYVVFIFIERRGRSAGLAKCFIAEKRGFPGFLFI
jgi:hypothetical protein